MNHRDVIQSAACAVTGLVLCLGITGSDTVAAVPGSASSMARLSTAVTADDSEWMKLRREYRVLHDSLLNKGIVDEDIPVIEEFIDRLEAFATSNPGNTLAPLSAATQLAIWLEDLDRTYLLFEQMVITNPENTDIADAWTKYFQQYGEEEQVRSAYDTLESLHPNDIDVLYRLLSYYERTDDVDKVMEILNRLAELDPENADQLGRSADYLVKRGRYDQALALVDGMELDPAENTLALVARATARFANQEFEQALDDLNSIPDDVLENSEAMLRSYVNQNRTLIQQYIDELWPIEEALREAEASADDLPRAEIVLDAGTIVVELFENQAPNTVANFIKLAEEEFYNDTAFHRVVSDFMAQGGDPNSKPGADPDADPGTGNAGYYIPDEHQQEDARMHFTGSLAMAKRDPPNTAGSQFFLTVKPTPWLNGRHTVFGRVLSGLDIVRNIKQDDRVLAVNVLRKRDHDYEPNTLPLPTLTNINPANRVAPSSGGSSAGALPIPTKSNDSSSSDDAGDDAATGGDGDGDGDGSGDGGQDDG